MLLGSVSSQQRFAETDIKAPLCMSQLSGLGQTVLYLSGLKRTVLQLLDKSVLQLHATALFYLANSRKIHLQGVRACRPKDVKRRAPQQVGEREREAFSSSFYMFFSSPWACPVKIGLRQKCCSTWSPHSGPRTFLCSIFAGFSLPCHLATTILDSCFLS